jgi:hypothetical protein
MFKIRRSRPLVVAALVAVAGALPACSAEDPITGDEAVAQTGAEPTMSYEEFRATAEWEPRRNMWIVEGDLPLRDENELREHYERTFGATGGLSVNQVNGVDDVWSRANRRNLTYCVSRASLGANYAATVAAMHQAAAGWEATANVQFIHLSAHDNNCNNANASVVFDVQAWSGSTGQAFFPSWQRKDRTLFLNWGASPQWPSDQRDLISIIMHELGHALGNIGSSSVSEESPSL